MNAIEVLKRRQHDIQMESDAALRISASASFLNLLVEQSPDVQREGYDFAFEGVVVRLNPKLPVNTFLIELVTAQQQRNSRRT